MAPPDAHLRRNLRPGDILLVRHNFEARSPDELSLRKGDRIQLLQLDEGFWDGWWTGRHLDPDELEDPQEEQNDDPESEPGAGAAAGGCGPGLRVGRGTERSGLFPGGEFACEF
ncbi:polar growth protein, partial [Ascosphaera acerosa]